MSKATLEFDLLSRLLLEPTEVVDLLELGIEPTAFRDPLARAVFEFALTHRASYGDLPDPATVLAKFAFEAQPVPEPLRFYCRELIQRSAALLMAGVLPEVQKALKAADVAGAQTALEEAVAAVRAEMNREIEVSSAHETAARVAHYEAVEAGTLPPGIPMPWVEFTEATLGWKPDNFGLIVARTGIGKSWYTIFNAHSAWADGKRVLVVSMEMNPTDLQQRHDAFVAQVPYDALQRGALNAVQKTRYLDAMREMSAFTGFDVVGYNMAASIGQIHAAIERVRPDIVFVDGAYLLKPTGYHPKMTRNDKLEAVAAELKVMAGMYSLPVVGSIQFNREQKKKAVDADLGHIFGSDTWAQNADFVFALMQTREDAADSVMRASLIKGRNCPVFASRLRWDLDAMEFDLLEFEKGQTSLKPPKPAAAPVTWRKP